jgi:hypothetical protein
VFAEVGRLNWYHCHKLIGAENRAHRALTEYHELELCCASWRKAVLLCKLHLEVGRALNELKVLQKALKVS